MKSILEILDRRIAELAPYAEGGDHDAWSRHQELVEVRALLAAELAKTPSTTLQFTAEDFRNYCIKNPGAPHDVCIAEVANAKLAAVLEKAPVTELAKAPSVPSDDGGGADEG
jgi:hypothetical protein